MAEKVQNLYRTPPAQPQKPKPVVRPIIRWTTRESLICVFLALLVVTAYFTVWKFQFVYFDDPGYVSENLDVLRGLPLFTDVERFKASVYWAFTAFEQSNWHPLTWLSHMLDIQLYQQWQGGHHITNIILHSLNTLLIFGLFWRMTGKSWRSAAVAAMFAVHPMHVESVAWVAERKDVLSTFFGLLTLHAYASYGAHARVNGGSILFAATLACFVGILGWLWYNQCFWYMSQVILFQQHASRAIPNGYDALSQTGPVFAAFATLFILAVAGVGGFAASSRRTRLLKYCGILIAFTLVGTVLLASFWNLKSFEGAKAQYWTNGIGVAVFILAAAGAIIAAIQQRATIAIQCVVAAACVAALLIVLNWIQLLPSSPSASPAWYNNPFQTAVERIWCCEFAVAIFVVFGSLAVDMVAGRRTNLALFCVVVLLYILGLLAKPMLVTLPFIMLLLDYWPLGRIDPQPGSEEEKPAPAAADTTRIARRRARERRRPGPAPVYVQNSSPWSKQEPFRTINRIAMLVIEKAPLFALAVVSSMVTPIAQSHGGSMASTSDLPIGFRLQNVMKSFGVYVGKMFWPGKMMSLHLLAQDERGQPYVEPKFFLIGVVVVAVLTTLAAAAVLKDLKWNRLGLIAGWFCYLLVVVSLIPLAQSSGTALKPETVAASCVILAVLGCVAIIAVLQKWRWLALTAGWVWYVLGLIPVFVCFEIWRAFIEGPTSVPSWPTLVPGVLTVLISIAMVVSFLKNWQWPLLNVVWFCFLGAMVPLMCFLHGWPSLAMAQIVMYTVLISPAIAAIAAVFFRKWKCSYLAVGWFWYVGILVPVIGFVQVGEQRWADRYTYVPYVGLFVAIVWTIGELVDRFPQWRPPLLFATAGGAVLLLTSWTSWTNYQIQSWHDVETHLVHALDVEPDNWNMLNNHGVFLWKEGDRWEAKRSRLLSEGKTREAQECEKEVLEYKDKARQSWIHGITSRPTATDIHSNLGYAYSEAASKAQEAASQLQAAAAQLEKTNPTESKRKLEESKQKQKESTDSLDKAELHLTKAVQLKDISPRPHNNLGRVLLRRSQQFEMDANAAEAKGKTDPAEAAKVKPLRDLAKLKLDQAIDQFERSVQLDPSLLEAHLNLGEVYTQLGKHDKATQHYAEILKYYNKEAIVDPSALANFSQAYFGLGRIALAQGKFDEAVKCLSDALKVNPGNMAAIDRLANELFLHGNFRDGEQVLRMWLGKLPPPARRQLAEQFGRRFEGDGKHELAVRAWVAMAWIFATSPEPQKGEPDLRDPQAALGIADGIAKMTKQQDPLVLDALAAALAESGQFPAAVQAAQAAIALANNQGNKSLAELIAQRLAFYQRQTPYVSKPDGSDRP
jgi:tetratricopeptide (TPR) repeat protein